MAGRPIATAFVRLRFFTDASTKAEADAQMQGVGATTAKRAATEGEKAGKTFGQKMASGLKSASSLAAKAGVVGLGALAFEVLKQGEELEKSQNRLNVAIKNTGGSAKAAGPALDTVRAKMERWGFTNADVNGSLSTLVTATGSVSDAIGAQATAANLARYQNISLSQASSQLAKAFAGNAKSLKGMNVTTATGATEAKALTSAQASLADQIQSAGSMASFARAHHLSLAAAQKLVAESSAAATHAMGELTDRGTTLATVTKLVSEAEAGSKPAVATLAKEHLSLAQAQKLVKQSAEGSIPALNRLGIVVLPKSATAAERYAQIQSVLNSRIGGEAQTASETAGGAFLAMKAQLTDLAAKIGAKVLPVLAKIITWANKSGILMPIVIALIVGLGAAMVASSIAAMTFATALTGGIALAVVAVIAGVILLIKHWAAVEKWLKDMWHWVEAHDMWLLMLPGLGWIVLAVIEVVKHWRALWDAFNDVWHHLDRLFTVQIPAALDIFQATVRLVWDWIEIRTLKLVYNITGYMGKLPGPLGAPFREAHKSIGTELAGIEGDVKKTAARINADWDRLHGKTVGVTFKSIFKDQNPLIHPAGFARGTSGAPPGWAWVGEAGPELVRMTGGETVLTNASSMAATRGFASGTGPQYRDRFVPGGASLDSAISADFGREETAYIAQMKKSSAMRAWMKSLMGNGAAIAAYAASFATGQGHPYVWGGMSPSGWDCSGFTSYVYDHFGYGPPRTSESQYGWVRRSNDQPGALVFFDSHDGQAAPSHVGISLGGGKMANAAGTAWGTIISGTGGNMGFGIPPGGFVGAGAGGTGGTKRESQLAELWIGAGGSRSIAHLMAAIAMAESGGRDNAYNPSGATGLWQILGPIIASDGPYLKDPRVNAREAVLKYRLQGLSAWSAYTNGSYQKFMGRGGVINEPVIGVGLRSGGGYTFGENGPETVVPGVGGRGDAALIREVRKLQNLVSRQGQDFADALNGVARRAGR